MPVDTINPIIQYEGNFFDLLQDIYGGGTAVSNSYIMDGLASFGLKGLFFISILLTVLFKLIDSIIEYPDPAANDTAICVAINTIHSLYLNNVYMKNCDKFVNVGLPLLNKDVKTIITKEDLNNGLETFLSLNKKGDESPLISLYI